MTLNDLNSTAIRTKHWHKGQWPLGVVGGRPRGSGLAVGPDLFFQGFGSYFPFTNWNGSLCCAE